MVGLLRVNPQTKKQTIKQTKVYKTRALIITLKKKKKKKNQPRSAFFPSFFSQESEARMTASVFRGLPRNLAGCVLS